MLEKRDEDQNNIIQQRLERTTEIQEKQADEKIIKIRKGMFMKS